MARVSRDIQNRRTIDDLLPSFEGITDVSPEIALGFHIEFNSINIRVKDAYTYGRMFLEEAEFQMQNEDAFRAYLADYESASAALAEILKAAKKR